MDSSVVSDSEGQAYEVGPLDMLVLFSFVGFLVYYFWKPKKKENEAILNGLQSLKLSSQPVVVDSSGFLVKMRTGGKKVAVFYGSQTGTAEEFANRLAKDASRYDIKAGVFDPEECEMEELIELKQEIPDCLVIFVMATYGEGDPTDNAVPFLEWLREERDLVGLNFAVFALGNKTYEHYQATGRYVDKRIEELGGNRVYERGEGDDDANIEEDFIEWRERFWPAVCKFYGIDESLVKGANRLSMSASRDYRLELLTDVAENRVFRGEVARVGSYDRQRPPYDAKNPFLASVVVNRELHKGGDRSCMHIEIDIAGSGIRYEAGDHVAVYPTNDPALVTRIGQLLDVDLDAVISLNNIDAASSKKHPFPCPTTYRTALLHYTDITSAVKQHVLSEFVKYTTDATELDKLSKMAEHDKEGKDLYQSWVVHDHRHIVSVLEDLPSCRPPLDLILELLPRLHVRYYSISSSPKLNPDRIHVTAVMVDWLTPTGRRQKGVATSWLKTKVPAADAPAKVPIFVRRTTFRLPSRENVPIIMIGPGTGLAPFRGFIQERHALRQKGVETGETVLYFGCRKKGEDFLYQEELENYVRDGTITDLQVAFSRDQPQKIYVTHKLRESMAKLWDVIKHGGHVYVCGDARNMAKDVHDIIVEAVRVCGEKTSDQAEGFVKKLGNTGKYSVDVWS